MTGRAPITPGRNSFAALKIYQQQHYPLSEMRFASWAGAFGQTQFTPTTFLKYAADGDGDGQDQPVALGARCAGIIGAIAGRPRLEARPALGL